MRAIALMLIGLALNATTAAAAERTFSKRIAAGQSDKVRISNVAGSVTVTAWDRPEVDVQAQLDRGVERVDVTHENGRSVIEIVLPRNSFGDGDAILKVRIPAGSQLETSTVSADIAVEGVRGPSRLRSVSGDVRTDVAGADVEVKTVSGDVILRGGGQSAEMRVSTVSGDVSLTHGAGELDASTTSGDLEVALDLARIVRIRSTSGDLKFSGRLSRTARLEVQTISGDVSVRAAAEAGYQYDISTFSGSIRNCFGEDAVRTNRYAPGSQLSGTRGPGEASVRLKTLSGGVNLCDR